VGAESMYVPDILRRLAGTEFTTQEGTLYPLLRRLEGQGLLASEWRIEDGPPRRYYKLSPHGETLFASLTQSWRGLVGIVDGLIDDEHTIRKRAST